MKRPCHKRHHGVTGPPISYRTIFLKKEGVPKEKTDVVEPPQPHRSTHEATFYPTAGTDEKKSD